MSGAVILSVVLKPAVSSFNKNASSQALVRNYRWASQSLVYLPFQVVLIQLKVEPLIAEKVLETIEEES